MNQLCHTQKLAEDEGADAGWIGKFRESHIKPVTQCIDFLEAGEWEKFARIIRDYSKPTTYRPKGMDEPIAELIYNVSKEAMEKYKKEGKIRAIGASTHHNEPAVIKATADSGIYDIIETAYNFRKNNAEEIGEAINYAADKGIGTVVMKTQAGVYWDRQRKNMINMQAALKWALQNENVHTSVPLFNNANELIEGLSVMNNSGTGPL